MATAPADDSTLQDSIDNPFVAEGSDLVVLADGDNHIAAVRATDRNITAGAAEQLLLGSLQNGNLTDWWYVDNDLYQMVLQSVDGSPLAQNKSGTVVLGRQIDYAAIQGLGNISGSLVVITRGGDVVASTLDTVDRYELARKLDDRATSGLIEIGQKRFYFSSVKLTSAPGPIVSLIILKPDQQASVSANGLNHAILRMAGVTLMLLLGLAMLAASGSRNRLVSARIAVDSDRAQLTGGDSPD